MTHKYFIFAFLAVALPLGLPLSARAGVRYKVLHHFGSGNDGSGPSGPLLLDSNGNLYGATFGGGNGCNGGCGTVFELSPQANGRWKEVILHGFSGGKGGYLPWGGIVLDRSGNLYGTMRGYLSYAVGGVYELSPGHGGWKFSVLYSQGPGGGFAGPGLLMDGLGNLYGEMGHGQYQGGAIAELSPGASGWTYTPLHSFDGTDGLAPGAPPIWDGKGNMFGTTVEGGIFKPPCQTIGCGVIYEMTPKGDGTWTYHVPHRFGSFKNDGQNPYYSGLVMDGAGSFYGATWFGGSHESGGYGQGTVYKLAYTGGKWKETILYDFPDCAYGCRVEGTLGLDKAGNLYGTASGGSGNCGYECGLVFKLAPQKNGRWKYSVLYNFTPAGGGFQPFYGVIVDDKGHLFGVTSNFGKYGGGTAFEIIP